MLTKYLIEEQTLRDIADSIREMNGSDDAILVEEYANKIGKIEPTVEEYMRISDYLDYPNTINESNYTTDKVNECKNFINFYTEMEETNG